MDARKGGLTAEDFADLKRMPGDPRGWNVRLAAHAYSTWARVARDVDLNLWAAMHVCRPSLRYRELGRRGVVLWHGTSAPNARQILEPGFRAHTNRAVFASRNPAVSFAYSGSRTDEGESGAIMCLIVPQHLMEEMFLFDEAMSEVRMYANAGRVGGCRPRRVRRQ
jgi:hypothetical protein